jgi:5-methylcytosine-specific restriction endonuclease McrA
VPIRPEQRALYPKDWKAISKRIREERAGNRCERCKAPNGKTVVRGEDSDAGTYMLEEGEVHDDETGKYLGRARGPEYQGGRFVRIVLTVAHLDHDPTNNADENLKALCQRCHLSHDREQHTANARATRRSRKASRELF